MYIKRNQKIIIDNKGKTITRAVHMYNEFSFEGFVRYKGRNMTVEYFGVNKWVSIKLIVKGSIYA